MEVAVSSVLFVFSSHTFGSSSHIESVQRFVFIAGNEVDEICKHFFFLFYVLLSGSSWTKGFHLGLLNPSISPFMWVSMHSIPDA